jgi:hypothetical protein
MRAALTLILGLLTPCRGLAHDESSWCRNGHKLWNYCCAASCGTCGGNKCEAKPGGAANCCTARIRESGRVCGKPPCRASTRLAAKILALANISDGQRPARPRKGTDYPPVNTTHMVSQLNHAFPALPQHASGAPITTRARVAHVIPVATCKDTCGTLSEAGLHAIRAMRAESNANHSIGMGMGERRKGLRTGRRDCLACPHVRQPRSQKRRSIFGRKKRRLHVPPRWVAQKGSVGGIVSCMRCTLSTCAAGALELWLLASVA